MIQCFIIFQPIVVVVPIIPLLPPFFGGFGDFQGGGLQGQMGRGVRLCYICGTETRGYTNISS